MARLGMGLHRNKGRSKDRRSAARMNWTAQAQCCTDGLDCTGAVLLLGFAVHEQGLLHRDGCMGFAVQGQGLCRGSNWWFLN